MTLIMRSRMAWRKVHKKPQIQKSVRMTLKVSKGENGRCIWYSRNQKSSQCEKDQNQEQTARMEECVDTLKWFLLTCICEFALETCEQFGCRCSMLKMCVPVLVKEMCSQSPLLFPHISWLRIPEAKSFSGVRGKSHWKSSRWFLPFFVSYRSIAVGCELSLRPEMRTYKNNVRLYCMGFLALWPWSRCSRPAKQKASVVRPVR